MAIITTAEYKTWRGISVSTYDTLIGILIAGANARGVEKYTGRFFDAGDYEELLDGSGGASLQVSAYPINSVASVKLWDNTNQTAYVTLTQYEDYHWNADSGLFYRTNAHTGRISEPVYRRGFLPDGVDGGSGWGTVPNWPRGPQTVRVDYNGGYSTMPDDLKLSMYQYVDAIWAKTWGEAALPTSPLIEERIDQHSYKLSDLDDITIKSAIARGMFEVQAQLAQFFGPWRRGDLL